MVETALTIPTPEQQTDAAVLPVGDDLRIIYSAEFGRVQSPTEYQMPQDIRYGDRVFSAGNADSPLTPAELRQEVRHPWTSQGLNE
jgi:hypothetical protein